MIKENEDSFASWIFVFMLIILAFEQILFLNFKLFKIVSWPWVYVFSPSIFFIAFVIFMLFILPLFCKLFWIFIDFIND